MEIWKDVIGFEKYYKVSNTGKVKIKRNQRHLTKTKSNGYLVVTLIFPVKKQQRVHRLVATAFIENKEGKPHVNHIDGDKHNNHLSNLEWATVEENLIHARENNLSNHRFDKNQIIDIRSQYKTGISIKKLAKGFNCDCATIREIVNHETYKYYL